jgi:hypothetical protein
MIHASEVFIQGYADTETRRITYRARHLQTGTIMKISAASSVHCAARFSESRAKLLDALEAELGRQAAVAR